MGLKNQRASNFTMCCCQAGFPLCQLPYSNPFKSIHNLVLLDLKLMIIADVLILTASAMGEIAAEGLFSVRRRNG